MKNLNEYIKNPTHKLIADAYKNATTLVEKEACFNEAEIKQLQEALHDVGRQLMAIAL